MTGSSDGWHSRLMGGWSFLVALWLGLLMGTSAAACVTDEDCADADPCTAPQVCHAGDCVDAFTLPVFPLDAGGVDAYDAEVVSTMDHSGTFYTNCCDTKIVAFTVETAVRNEEAILCPEPPIFPQCLFATCLCGYLHPSGGEFVVTGNYASPFGPQYLYYDGHAGYDYLYGSGTPIRAAAAGNLCKAQEDPINGRVGASSAWDKFHTFYIDHGVWGGKGYATWYLHAADLQGEDLTGQPLQSLSPGECGAVAQGQVVAGVGKVGTFLPHLHFEVRTYVAADGPKASTTKAIDPYGWRGNGPDPLANPLENPQAESQSEALWIACGNGRLDCGEQCDDGNRSNGDCCSAACAFEAAGSGCNDANVCTLADQCDGSGNCAGTCDAGAACLAACGGRCEETGGVCRCGP